MRNRYLVCYDISEPKRLRRTFKKMNGFGDPVQYSVFLCNLSPKERVMLEEALTDVINMKEDRVMIVNLGPVDGRGDGSIATLGKAQKLVSPSAIVV